MILKKRFILLCVLIGVFYPIIWASEPIVISDSVKSEIRREADDLIEKIANEGGQMGLALAVEHALYGDFNDLNIIRNSSDYDIKNINVADVETTLLSVGFGLNLRMYRSSGTSDKKLPALLYFHGGGWTYGSVRQSDAMCRMLAAKGDRIVLAGDYRNAPECDYVEASEDCKLLMEYLLSHAEELGVDLKNISIGGSDSGATLALKTVLENDTFPSPIKVIAISPIIRTTPDTQGSWRTYRIGYGNDSRLAEAQLKAAKKDKDVETFIELQTKPNLTNIIKILIIGAERDILHDEAILLDKELLEHGVNSNYIELSGAIHGFSEQRDQPAAFNETIRIITDFLER